MKELESKRNACFRVACPVNFLKTQKCGSDSFVALNVQFLKSVSYRFLSAALVFAGKRRRKDKVRFKFFIAPVKTAFPRRGGGKNVKVVLRLIRAEKKSFLHSALFYREEIMKPIEIIIVIAAVAIVAAVIVCAIIRKKQGKSSGCDCGCSSCPYSGACASRKAKKPSKPNK